MDVLLVGGSSDPLTEIENALSSKGRTARVARTLGEARSALADEGTPHAVLLAPGLAPPDAVLLASSLRVRHRQCRVIAMLSAAESSRAGELERVGVKEVMPAGTPASSVAEALARPITATPS